MDGRVDLPAALEPLRLRHDVRSSFWDLLRDALCGEPVGVGLGPLYEEDPAAEVLAPFVRSARETGWTADQDSVGFAPPWVLMRAHDLRTHVAQLAWQDPKGLCLDLADLDQWTRAGLVLEIAARGGIPYGQGRHHVRWKLRGTVTGRFGVESGGFNPLVIPAERRSMISAGPGRMIVAMDFAAMDLCSMLALVPDLKDRYHGAPDLHDRTAELMGLDREAAKLEIFRHAYGGHSFYGVSFRTNLPELEWLRVKPHGDGARLVQTTSARAFRAALSMALPLLVGADVRPLFTVHDEVVLDASEGAGRQVEHVAKALQEGASQTIGVPYRVKVRTGRDYAEVKG